LGGAARGLGDDCAFLPGGWCVSLDVSVEGVHFRREWLDPAEIGWRAAMAALSDLAAVGATAEAVLVGLGAPADEPVAAVAAIMGGVGDAARELGASVVGGDLTRAADLSLAVTVMGRTDHPVRRRGARPGDRIWVTGSLGGARAAVAAWTAGRHPEAGPRQRFARPVARIAEGRRLAELGATAMLDLSDGLGGDLRHLAAASGVGLVVELDRLPLAEGVAAAARHAGQPPAVFAAIGGEDFELLVTLPPGVDAAPLTPIGMVTAGPGVSTTLAGIEWTLAGYDHFR
jgi:thiamine-monophosphate kinase